MTLSHFDLKNAKVADKPYKLADGGGLFLYVQPNGSRHWRMKFKFLGKEGLLSFGAYPLFSLAEAREKREEAKKLIAQGIDPGVKKKLDRIKAEVAAANTFGLIQFVEITADTAFAATHVLGELGLTGKAGFVAPGVFQQHGVGELRAN